MRRRAVLMPLVVVPALLALVGPGCSSKSKAVDLGLGCALNSDCDSPLVCVFSLCHEACEQSRDCPPGQSCIASGTDNVCTLPSESSCPTGTCAIDTLSCDLTTHTCMNPCTTAGCPVSGQVCVGAVCQNVPDDAGLEASIGDSSSHEGSTGDATTPPDADASNPIESGPPTDGGPLGFIASNLPPGDVVSAADAGDGGPPAVTISTTCSDCLPVAPVTITQNDGSPASLYVLQSLTVDTTATLSLGGPNVVILAVLGPVSIDGILSVAAAQTIPNAGGFAPGPNPGPGGGQQGVGTYSNSGGGGASFCGVGGAGSPYVAGEPVTSGGPTYGGPTITPLIGGSAGGGSGGDPTGGGGGGGIQIVSATSIVVGPAGAVNAGGGGSVGGNASGGGSGGVILLEAPTVTIAGALAANGGGGGPGGANATANAQPASGGIDGLSHVTGGSGSAGTAIVGSPGVIMDSAQGGGGGGAGRIRINTASGAATITGVLSPDPSTSCVSQGKIGG